MKILFITICLASFLLSDEIQRIESVVQDIEKLQNDYEKCKKSLEGAKDIKIEVVEYFSDDNKYKKLLKNREVDIENLKDKIALLESKNKTLNKELSQKKYLKIEDKNKFPKLMPKIAKPLPKKEVKKEMQKIEIFTASSFKLNKNSDIFDSPQGNKIISWKKGRSFTSNKKMGSWIKITGYFVDKKWKQARKDLWIENLYIYEK